jgi:hypothetical protein
MIGSLVVMVVTWQYIFAPIIIFFGTHKINMHADLFYVCCGENESHLVFWIVKLDLLDSSCCEMSSLLVVQYIKELVAWVGR